MSLEISDPEEYWRVRWNIKRFSDAPLPPEGRMWVCCGAWEAVSAPGPFEVTHDALVGPACDDIDDWGEEDVSDDRDEWLEWAESLRRWD